MLIVRRAGPADVAALAAVATEAYRGYVARIGRRRPR
jgi:Tfp pilus assembly protein PilE